MAETTTMQSIPGPWRVREQDDQIVEASDCVTVGYCATSMMTDRTRTIRVTPEQAAANARLIAAAPELLEAVKALLAAADHTYPAKWRRDRPVSLAKAAIAKAEGRG